MTRSLIAALLAAAALPHAALAADPRIRQVGYDPLSVTDLHGCFGFQSTVAFAPGERIENVALGDATLWQAVPNKRADLLFLKPAVKSGRTNMTVVTDRRRYAFDLVARDDAACRAGHVTYELQFAYPAEPEPVAAEPAPTPLAAALPPVPAALDEMPAPGARNTAYTFTGASANVPARVFDDGRSTWLRWADGASAPAIYALGPDKSESLLNYVVKGDYLVIDGVGPAYVLRRGSAVAVLYNDAYQQPRLDADAPHPRGQASAASPAKRTLMARLFGPAASSSQETSR
jgi:type IV secretion system protein VirB9